MGNLPAAGIKTWLFEQACFPVIALCAGMQRDTNAVKRGLFGYGFTFGMAFVQELPVIFRSRAPW